MKQIVIVGGGPTGATLALLLVKQGIKVTLIEAAKSFNRVFRGEGLMPSGLDAIEQMGLSKILKNVPNRPLDAWEFIIEDKQLFRVDEPMGSDFPCTLVSQPPLLEAIITECDRYSEFEFIRGVAVSDLLLGEDRCIGVKLADDREIKADLTIGADGRNSVIRQRAGLELVKSPKNIDLLWFKLPSHDRFVKDNVFCAIAKNNRGFSVFHGAETGKLHLAWVVSADRKTDFKNTNWAETFASLSPQWLAEHFRSCADKIESPIKLSVAIGLCPKWYKPGVLLLGDAAHPMSPIRAQGINMALRDVIVAVDLLAPLFTSGANYNAIDLALSKIQAAREPEIKRIQKLQKNEAIRAELIKNNPIIRSLLSLFSPLVGNIIKQKWVKDQYQMRQGITTVKLIV